MKWQVWRPALYRSAGLLLLAMGLGGLLGEPSRGLALMSLALLGWHGLHLFRFLNQLTEQRPYRWPLWLPVDVVRWLTPARDSVWALIDNDYQRLRSQSRKRKRKRTRLLRQFRDAAMSLPDAVVVLDGDDTVQWLNPQATTLLGLAEQDVGRPITALLRQPNFVNYLARRAYHESLEVAGPTHDDRLLNLRLTNYGKKQNLLIATDISRLRRLERTRQDFAANISHELRTPLTVITGYLETLVDSDAPELQPWQAPLQQAQIQAHRMLFIIQDMLYLSRLETEGQLPPNKPVAVPGMAMTLVEDAQALSQGRHEFEVHLDEHLWLLGAEAELRSAFSNLLFNAVNHTPRGSVIALDWYSDGLAVYFTVQDDGDGIPPEHIPRLTERFYRVERGRPRERGGTGLGLAIVKYVVRRHGGELQIHSEVGIGSRFTCVFPLSRRLERPPQAVMAASAD